MMILTPNSVDNRSPLAFARAFLRPLARVAPRVTALCLGAALCVTGARATLPTGITTTPLYKKGYLNVTSYQWAGREVYNDGTNAPSTTAGLNEAINDSRDNGVALYFPAGTYLINDTLKCYTATDAATNTHGIVMVGSTTGARPIIRLTAGNINFSDAANPKVIVEFKNFIDANFVTEKSSQGYESMIRGIDINCNATAVYNGRTNAGAIGLYMNLAQECSIENVTITATGAYTGILGLPSRGWGGVNIEVDGGQYGIDTLGTANMGSTLVGLILKNQTVSSIRHTGQPLTVVGFEIVTPSNPPGPSGLAAVKLATEASNNAATGALALIDGKITLGTVPTVAAIDNTKQANIYVRNVYVTGSTKLVKSVTAPVSSSGTWELLKEYSYTKQTSSDFESWTLINGTVDQPPTANNGENYSTQANAGAPPADLRSRHVWASLPSFEDADAYDPAYAMTGGVATITANAFQTMLDANPKVFLRKGTYKIDGPITLNSNTRLFGVARTLTTLQPNDAAWQPTGPVTFITTANWVSASTYLGDLQVSVPKMGPSDGTQDYFSALQWRAGADSMLHIASIGQIGTGMPTTAKSLVKVTNNGGGRWYFFGRRDGNGMQNRDFRILDVLNTLGNPLWIYGMNMEHARSDVFGEITNSDNIRIYGLKTEFAGEYDGGAANTDCTFLSFTHVHNVVMAGHSALRYSSDPGFSSQEFIKNSLGSSDRVVAALIAPQENKFPQGTGTLTETYNTTTNKVTFPATVSLFKRGTITTADEALMVHNDISY